MVIYDARPNAYNQLTTTSDWEAFTSVVGEATVSAIDGSVGSAMVPSLDTAGRNAVLADGNAVIKGMLWRTDAAVSTPIPVASAQNRIDRLVLRLNRGATTSATVIQPVVITGTPAASSPQEPPLTQTPTGIWDIPVCSWVSQSNGALSGLVDERRPTNDPWHDMRPLSNGISGTISGYEPPQYRFRDDGRYVELGGYVQLGSNGNYNNLPFFNFPSRYRPVNGRGTVWATTAPGLPSFANTYSCQMQVWGSGNIQFYNLPNPAGGLQFCLSGLSYPLEDSNGFLPASP